LVSVYFGDCGSISVGRMHLWLDECGRTRPAWSHLFRMTGPRRATDDTIRVGSDQTCPRRCPRCLIIDRWSVAQAGRRCSDFPSRIYTHRARVKTTSHRYCATLTGYGQLRNQGGVNGFIPPAKMPKLDLTANAEYVANLVSSVICVVVNVQECSLLHGYVRSATALATEVFSAAVPRVWNVLPS